jgi:hypothetical protein
MSAATAITGSQSRRGAKPASATAAANAVEAWPDGNEGLSGIATSASVPVGLGRPTISLSATVRPNDTGTAIAAAIAGRGLRAIKHTSAAPTVSSANRTGRLESAMKSSSTSPP